MNQPLSVGASTGAQATVQAAAAVAAIQGVSTTEFTNVIVSWDGWMDG